MEGEIGAYGWFPIDQLPDTFEANQQGYRSAAGTRHSFHNVWQFVSRLKRWIRRSQGSKRAARKNNNGKQKGAKGVTSSGSLLLQNSSLPTNEQSGALHTAQSARSIVSTNREAAHISKTEKPQVANGKATPMSTSSSSLGSQESTQSHIPSAHQHAWLGFKLNAAPILDQLK